MKQTLEPFNSLVNALGLSELPKRILKPVENDFLNALHHLKRPLNPCIFLEPLEAISNTMKRVCESLEPLEAFETPP